MKQDPASLNLPDQLNGTGTHLVISGVIPHSAVTQKFTRG